jgi:LuxR family maltose regulon positive regulatory protein
MSTKLHIPALRPGRVLRPRLLQCLNAGLPGKVNLISAPAGFGKTTIVSEWIRQVGRPVAWLSLDEQDNDPLRFLTYLVRALQSICPDFGESVLENLQTLQRKGVSPEQSDFLDEFVSEIAAIPMAFILVLDDYHVITQPTVQDMLQFLLNYQPETMHWVIATRTDPPWPLGRLRARRELNEVRASDLRFTPQESEEFLNDRMGLELTALDVAALEGRTEGWIAGLQLAALSLQGQIDRHQFIEDLAGSHRFIFDYLVEEALEKQPPDIQDFLLQTSLLQQMNAGLCDALTGRSDSQDVLLYLERSNLFLQPLDHDRYWYRYHHLFADLLRIKLGQTRSAQVPALHRSASLWFEKNKLIAESIHHALLAGDFELVVRLVKGKAFSMLDTGELFTLLGWLDAIPRDLVLCEPWMSVFYAWALAYTGQLKRAEEYLLQAESGLVDSPTPYPSQHSQEYLMGHIAAIRALIAKNTGEMSRAIEFAQVALNYLPEQDYKTRCYVAQTQGNALLAVGKLDAAAQAFQSAIIASQRAEDIHRVIHALCDLSGLQWMLGQLRNADASSREALRLVERNIEGEHRSPDSGYAYARRSRILLEWNQVEAAWQHVEQGIALSQRRGQADILFFCLVTRAEIQISIKDVPGALDTLQKVRLITGGGAAWHETLLDQFENEAHLSAGNVATAECWLQKFGWKPGDAIPADQANAFEFIARILVAKREYAAAVRLLDHLIAQEQAKGVLAFVLLFRLTLAVAWQRLGNLEQALNALNLALAQAEPEGYIRTFTDRGAPIRSLLQKAAERGMHPEYVRRLLDVFEDPKARDVPLPSQPAAPQPVEPFSERELEVLRLLNTDLVAPEIADRLIISTHTVRSHIKSIYRKLNVHGRYEAVLQAKALHLL